MHPPVDPWGSPNDPTAPQPPRYDRAAVPVPPRPRDPNTAEFWVLDPTLPQPPRAGRGSRRRVLAGPVAPGHHADRPIPAVSWQKASTAARRTLFDGWGFTATGMIVLFCGWGLWAVARTGGGVPAIFGLLITVAVAAMVFAALRLLSQVVLERIMRRPRPHARWSHFLTGLFLTAVGLGYLANSAWLVDAVAWVRDQWAQR